MAESPVFMFDNSDPEMQRAYEKARATFLYFWREMAWERRRIIPGLDLAAVKAPFSDGACFLFGVWRLVWCAEYRWSWFGWLWLFLMWVNLCLVVPVIGH